MSGIAALLALAVTLLALSAWSCWCETRRGDIYQQWMIEESIRADKAESRAAWRMLTKDEREFLQALHIAYEESANQTGYVNAAAQADSRKSAAIIRGLLERLGGGR